MFNERISRESESEVILDVETEQGFLAAAGRGGGGRGVQPRDARRTRWAWVILIMVIGHW